MQSFKEYVVDEFKVDGTTSISFKFTHTLAVKLDKKSKRPLNNHVVNVVVQFYDRDLNLLRKETLKFINNVLNKKDSERLVNIAPKELENRFNVARRDIVNDIKQDYLQKLNNINDKIGALDMYEPNVSSIIPTEFKGELIQMAKPKFEM